MPRPVPPLGLYVHLPWCVRKCPYCDFNSHVPRPGGVPEADYVAALLRDLDTVREAASGRALQSVFIGGGTPSLFSPEAIGEVLEGVHARLPCAADMEVTLEANPGTVEQARFEGFRRAGVNRLSIGVQSFEPRHLKALGRIHGRAEALDAARAVRAAGFDNFNLDLMFALPGQSVAEAEADVAQACALAPAHISWYQLTLEPGTPFHHRPPAVPDDDAAWAIQSAGSRVLAAHGYRQYEVSAYARGGRACRHNLNYWRFGDYLGIGAGAHAKLTLPDGSIRREARVRHPYRYMAAAGTPAGLVEAREVAPAERPFEFLMNALRLREGIDLDTYRSRTGLQPASLEPALGAAIDSGLLEREGRRIRATERGWRHLDAVLMEFLPEITEAPPCSTKSTSPAPIAARS